MTELEQAKLQAEIDNLRAQAAKAAADAAKAEADRASSRRTWRDWSLEAIKLIGAIALGAGGLTAAITGYQMSELKKEKMDLEVTKAKAMLADLEGRKAATDEAVKRAQEQLAAVKTEVDGLQRALESARSARTGAGAPGAGVGRGDTNGNLDEAITRAAEIGKALSLTNASLKSSAQPEQAGPRKRADYLVGLQTLGLADAARTELNGRIQGEGWGLHPTSASYGAGEKPGWFAGRSTVFYYSTASQKAAAELAEAMHTLTGETFAVQRGSGAGVDPSQRDVTLFVHYMKK